MNICAKIRCVFETQVSFAIVLPLNAVYKNCSIVSSVNFRKGNEEEEEVSKIDY